jgi:hypothetical protein
MQKEGAPGTELAELYGVWGTSWKAGNTVARRGASCSQSWHVCLPAVCGRHVCTVQLDSSMCTVGWEHVAGWHKLYLAMMLRILPGTKMTLRIALLSSCFCTLATARASATAPSSSMSALTLTVPRILPFTCTGRVISS